jgi:hypothetical protein
LEALVVLPSLALVALEAYPAVQVEHPLEALVERPSRALVALEALQERPFQAVLVALAA